MKPTAPDYSKALVRRLIGTPGSKRPTPVYVVAHEKYGIPKGQR